jgi:glycosyltransferase involved in cell wall biosynthesis
VEPFSACTIVARNYLPAARVLARSFARQHPDLEFSVLVIDDPRFEPHPGEPFRALTLGDVGLGGSLGTEMAATYTVMELATAVKPWLLNTLVTATGRPVLYLDPDTEIFAPLDHLAELAHTHGLVLTPHLLSPLPRDGRTIEEVDILMAGIYNLGFIGVGPSGLHSGFLRFWQERLRRDAVVDIANTLFTDQRWVDFIDCFPHHVHRNPGCNVAYWNIAGRSLSRLGDVLLIDGNPLVFFHFSGFDPRRPHILSRHQGRKPRILLSEHRVLAWLCDRYARRLLDEGYEAMIDRPYGWDVTPAGQRLDPALRRTYRAALKEADRLRTDPPPNPFTATDAFQAWVESAELGVTELPAYLHALWTLHIDLQSAFPDPLRNGASARRFVEWAGNEIDSRVGEIPAGLRRRLRQVATIDAPGSPPPPGLNVLGYLDAELGVGQAARLLLRAAGAAGVPVSAASSTDTMNALDHESGPGWDAGWRFDTNVFCVNADMLAEVRGRLPDHRLNDRNSVGVWFWETEVFPERFWGSFDLVDEVWAPSEFIAGALERTGQGRVARIPLPVEVPTWRSTATREDLGLPEGFLFLFTFDFASVVERKNPLGLVEAYSRAFSPAEGTQLVIKTIGGQHHWEQLEHLRRAIDRPDIRILDGHVRSRHVKAMIERCDCYVSLHRSEGFGLGLAEAMALGRPVVATGWSGNLDFMDEDTAHLVPCDLVPIPPETPVYGGLGRWADPDLGAAAAALRQVHDDPGAAAALGARARAHIARTRDPRITGAALLAHAERLRQHRLVPA